MNLNLTLILGLMLLVGSACAVNRFSSRATMNEEMVPPPTALAESLAAAQRPEAETEENGLTDNGNTSAKSPVFEAVPATPTFSNLTPAQQKALDDLRNYGEAPEIYNEIWFNSEPLRLADLRGKVVIVDFWTFG